MTRVLVSLAAGLTLAAGQLAATPAAVAKGPDGATIEGGGQLVAVTWQRTGGPGTMADLLTVTGFWGLPRGLDAGRPVRPPAEHGPAYVVRYDLGVPGAREAVFRQVLYPASSAGPVVFTPPGQRPYDVAVRGGWAKARVDLTLFLRGYGITVPERTESQTGAIAAAGNENRRPGWWPAAGLVVLVLLGLTGAWLVRRRSD